ncbi:GGDEF domain-containing protein [Desulforhopalus sp. IMCC35007]|uniref:GGDEF domain-containing protein n=1 Tax=Desulforhopalus sp. IMCC35007 TaxID=2569543 RepID=UPI0010AEE457|nr:GGDEF domain-containing protein [Desulforhopalus sp. IMCC35007]TKB06151.1 GGDEF domain-containing protein [Desulforhopalus sp. IMCC35007]
MKIRKSSSHRSTGTSATNSTSAATAAKAYADASVAPARTITDTTTIMGIPEAELTPKVREAILTLMQEVDNLRRSMDGMSKRLAATEALADQDVLLPIYNRRAFVRELTRLQATVERYNSDASLVYIDLDNFKSVNDTYGHSAGDYLLSEFSARLMDSVRETDIVGRLGGDEFGLILSHTHREAANTMTGRLAKDLKENPVLWEGNPLEVGMSYGIVAIEPGRDVQDTMDLADSAMYQQKLKGNK